MADEPFKLSAPDPRSLRGRKLSPLPKLDYSTDRKATNSERRLWEWLHSNALEEVRGDAYRAAFLQAMNPRRLSRADRDILCIALFGQERVEIVYGESET